MPGAWRALLLASLVPLAAAEAEEDKPNPYTAAGDSTQECYAWAADGQCVANPGFMLSSCKYSCWEWFDHRKNRFPDAPIDKLFSCNSWASGGECGKNPDYSARILFLTHRPPACRVEHIPRRHPAKQLTRTCSPHSEKVVL